MNIISEKRVIDKWTANVITNLDNGNEITIAFCGEGGAIVSGKTYDEAERKFIDAMNLADSVVKLNHFVKHGKFPEHGATHK